MFEAVQAEDGLITRIVRYGATDVTCPDSVRRSAGSGLHIRVFNVVASEMHTPTNMMMLLLPALVGRYVGQNAGD